MINDSPENQESSTTMMRSIKESTRPGMSGQTSAGAGAATVGGHGEETISSMRVASGPQTSSEMGGTGLGGGNATVSNTTDRRGSSSEVSTDSDCESVKTVCTAEEEELLKEPPKEKVTSVTSDKRIVGSRQKTEGRKALDRYKSAIRLEALLCEKSDRTAVEEEKLAWARKEVERGREFYRLKSGTSTATNRVEKNVLSKLEKKRHRSAEDNDAPTRTAKKPRGNDHAQGSSGKAVAAPSTSKAKPSISEVVKNHLIVALIDRSDPHGRMSLDRWRLVEAKLLDRLVKAMEEDEMQTMPSFDGAGWLNGVKIVKCNDQATLDWCRKAVKEIAGLWENAALEVVDRADIPSEPKAKVYLPRSLAPEVSLKLLQKQNPAIPSADWKVLKAIKPGPGAGKPSKTEDPGQVLVLQINKEAEDLLYPKKGKMAWGMGCVYLRLKRRKNSKGNDNTLEEGEIEKDLGGVEARTRNLTLEQEGNLATNPLDVEGAADQSAP